MKYYFSSSARAYSLLKELGAKSYLLSFAVDGSKALEMKNEDVLIDSGAFSVWNSGKTINIEDYISFCKKLPERWWFINLDIIPPNNASEEEIEQCCKKSFENYLYLKQHLKNVLPVYHHGEDIKWLHKYIEYTDYVGVGLNKVSEKKKRAFFKEIFNITTDKIKVHAMGYSSFPGLTMFPFYSVDSISFKKSKINGKLFWNEDIKLWFYLRKRIKDFLRLEVEITQLWTLRGVKWH